MSEVLHKSKLDISGLLVKHLKCFCSEVVEEKYSPNDMLNFRDN